MSDTNNIYAEIKAPQLSDAKYGDNLDSQFNAINSNFTKIGSSAFTRGDKGDSVNAYRLDITDKVKDTYKDDYKKGIIAQAIYMGLDQDGLGPIPISKDAKIEVSVIINDIENPILKSFWSLYVAGKTPWSTSKNLLSVVENILIDIMPFFYIDKNFYSENLNLPNDKKDKTGIYTFENISPRDGLRILFTQNPISQSIYYNTNKETWCWALGSNQTDIPIYKQTDIPIYKQTYDDKILIPWGDDKDTYHAMYVYKGSDEGTRKNSLAISPYRKNKNDQWEAIKWESTDEDSTWPELNLDNYYLVHANRVLANSGYFRTLSSQRFYTEDIISTGNIKAEGNIIVKNGQILNNSGSIESRAIWGDIIGSKKINITKKDDGTEGSLEVAGYTTLGEVTIEGSLEVNSESYFNAIVNFCNCNIRLLNGPSRAVKGTYNASTNTLDFDISNIYN